MTEEVLGQAWSATGSKNTINANFSTIAHEAMSLALTRSSDYCYCIDKPQNE